MRFLVSKFKFIEVYLLRLSFISYVRKSNDFHKYMWVKIAKTEHKTEQKQRLQMPSPKCYERRKDFFPQKCRGGKKPKTEGKTEDITETDSEKCRGRKRPQNRR